MKIAGKKLLLIFNIQDKRDEMIWNPSLEDRDAFQKEQQGREIRQIYMYIYKSLYKYT